jgi:hypothetical protein
VLVWVVGGLYRGIIIWIKMCEVVWVEEGLEVVLGRLCGWVWGMVKTIFFQLGKCSKIFVNTSVFSDSTGMSTALFVSKPSIILQLNLACQIISNQLTNFYISTSIMLSLTIYLALLLSQIQALACLRPQPFQS